MKQIYKLLSGFLLITCVIACYDDKGNLFPIESDEEWSMVEEVINTFVEDEENA